MTIQDTPDHTLTEMAAIGANSFEGITSARAPMPSLDEWLERARNEYTIVHCTIRLLRVDDTELEQKARDIGPEALIELCESCGSLLRPSTVSGHLKRS